MLLTLGPAQARPAGDPHEIMEQLSRLRLATGDTYRVRDITLRRDTLSVSFTRGVLAFLEPVDGRVTGAVYMGSGDVLAIPPDDIERRQLHRFTGSPILNERFDAAILRFTDETRAEVLELIRSRAGEDIRAEDLEALLPWDENLGETSRLLNFRLLADLIGSPDRPIFFAALRGENLGWLDVVYDERNAEEVAIGGAGRSRTGSQGRSIWSSFNRRSESRDPMLYGSEVASEIDVLSYRIDTTITAGGDLTATTRMSLLARRAGERVLGFHLTPSLRLSDVRFEGRSIPFFQHPAPETREGGTTDRFVVVLPRPTAEAEGLGLEFDYSGHVLERRGNGVYYVSERILWYPHAGVLDPARYDLTFHFPRDNVLVATGQLSGEWEDGGLRHSAWTSGGEFVVAGFNYGDFSVESDESGAVPIYVHVNNEVETVFEELSARRAVNTESALSVLQSRWGWRGTARSRPVMPDYDLFSTRRLAANVVRQVRSIVEFFSPRLGGYPFDRLSVSQFPVAFSQGWPSLLYVSTVAFFDTEQRARLNLDRSDDRLQTDYVLAHEIAHQWFGNSVSWRSYRDQWIGEGFSNYLALLYLDEAGGRGRSGAMLEALQRRLLSVSGSGEVYDDNGPVWLGQRLATSSVPEGYEETIYPKATWIVHMLRMLMRDESGNFDDRFFFMVREYLDEFAGGSATTWDLKAVSERYMTDRMDLDGDGTLDWFFDQWVFGTGVPEYALSYEVAPEAAGRFSVKGTISDRQMLDFRVPLPVYARTPAGELRYIDDVVVSGRQADFDLGLDYRPVQVLLDPYRTVLRR